ncbi:fructosamine kinase family protein [Uliginosibacterium gangwonense]|uniref:fructosamine kinase family protein n=1 Tax=Uliginosibacterium gangwonense TaxID=392736 RepID=UPI00037B22FE|nr:fructosamine kinase family protein [Uliginosibacterium gangwonense]
MIDLQLQNTLQEALHNQLGNAFGIDRMEIVAGGDINTALRLSGPQGSVFAKLRPAQDMAMFEAEAEGLRALSHCDAICVPKVLACTQAGNMASLLLEWLDIQPIRSESEACRAGEALAALHGCKGEHFGWMHDNFIGSTPQCNTESDNWAQFFVRRRLQPQFALAAQNGFGATFKPYAEAIFEKSPAFFIEYHPTPSLLHGDLWSGNLGALPDGTPVLFDPACYYGDRETDVAMSELFGGLPVAFYAAYRKAQPLSAGHELRKPLYNLYHILNHLNLFGRSYLGQAERMASSLARALKC